MKQMVQHMRYACILFLAAVLIPGIATAQDCTVEDRSCVIDMMHATADAIDKKAWRDQTYREVAKTLAFEGRTDEAIAIIEKIETPDTKAMTIRGIGMAIAENKTPPEIYGAVFTKLRAEADKIDHKASYAIALTYIAMAQAFAGDNDGAWKTAADMSNAALRNKAYGETAEIQAEKGNFEAAIKSIGLIESASFRDKAHGLITKILAERGQLDDALKAAQKIENAYKKAEALQTVLDIQKPREQPH